MISNLAVHVSMVCFIYFYGDYCVMLIGTTTVGTGYWRDRSASFWRYGTELMLQLLASTFLEMHTLLSEFVIFLRNQCLKPSNDATPDTSEKVHLGSLNDTSITW